MYIIKKHVFKKSFKSEQKITQQKDIYEERRVLCGILMTLNINLLAFSSENGEIFLKKISECLELKTRSLRLSQVLCEYKR